MKLKILLCAALAPLFLLSSAQHLKCTTDELAIYNANRKVIDSVYFHRYPEELMKIVNRYEVPAEGHDRLEHYVQNREFKSICQDYLNKDSLEQRVRNKMLIENVYQDSINTVLIPAYNNHLSGENVSYALHCCRQLHLDQAQYSYIMTKAIDMARRIRRDYRTNVWNEEMEILKKTLDKKQLRSFFVAKNAVKITDEFDKAWAKLKSAGLTEQLDSAKDANDAVNYMFNRQMIKDLYRGYGTPQKKNLAELDKSKPKMIHMLEGLDKKVRIEEKNKTVGKEFIW